MLNDVLEGLKNSHKSLPSKYFYDEEGSRLFEKITHLDEYYPTRTELKIMRRNLQEIATYIGDDSVLVELGSGSSRKTRILLDELPELAAYVPVEISERYLTDVVRNLKKEYPNLLIKPVCADYTKPFEVPPIQKAHTFYVLFYPGSTIGNFQPQQARKFLGTVSQILNPGGGMLIGVDIKKDTDVLEAAYNDSQGITAAFNKNILKHINQKIDGDFNPDLFSHVAFYNREKGRIEMHLRSQTDQEVHLGGKKIYLKKGETIHTENSYKYTLDEFKHLVHPWFSVDKVWTDEKNYFSFQYLRKK